MTRLHSFLYRHLSLSEMKISSIFVYKISNFLGKYFLFLNWQLIALCILLCWGSVTAGVFTIQLTTKLREMDTLASEATISDKGSNYVKLFCLSCQLIIYFQNKFRFRRDFWYWKAKRKTRKSSQKKKKNIHEVYPFPVTVYVKFSSHLLEILLHFAVILNTAAILCHPMTWWIRTPGQLKGYFA